MTAVRIIPCLQLIDASLVKTIRFKDHRYIGDPINTVRIFNELEVDELCFLDIRATSQHRTPNLDILHQIADECFMPLSYGGGITSFDEVRSIMSIGFEKVVVNSGAIQDPSLITRLSDHFGSQAVIGSIDVKKDLWGRYRVYSNNGVTRTPWEPVAWAIELEHRGAGEILLTSIDRDGTWSGFDLEITRSVSSAVSIPVIANGGAGRVDHIGQAVKMGLASAVALGSMVVFQNKGMGVLVNFPDRVKLSAVLQ